MLPVFTGPALESRLVPPRPSGIAQYLVGGVQEHGSHGAGDDDIRPEGIERDDQSPGDYDPQVADHIVA